MVERLSNLPRFIKEIFLLIIIVLIAFTIMVSISMNEFLEGVEFKSLLSSKFDFVSSYKNLMGISIAEMKLNIEEFFEDKESEEVRRERELINIPIDIDKNVADALNPPKDNSAMKAAIAMGIPDMSLDKINIIKYPTKQAPPKKISGREGIKYLVIHYVASIKDTNNSAINVCGGWDSRSTGVAADYVVDQDLIVQYNPKIGEYGYYQCGIDWGVNMEGRGDFAFINGNGNSIGIETCNYADRNVYNSMPNGEAIINHSTTGFSSKTLYNLVLLSKAIMKKYNIPPWRVIRHYDASGKPCPGVDGWNLETDESEWLQFKRAITSEEYKDIYSYQGVKNDIVFDYRYTGVKIPHDKSNIANKSKSVSLMYKKFKSKYKGFIEE